MPIVTWTLSNWRLVVSCALLIGAYAFGYSTGAENVRTKWNADKAENKRLADIQANKAREKERIANETTTKIQLNYAKSQADLAAARAGLNRRLCDAGTVPRKEGVRVATAGGDTVPTTSESATRTAENTEAQASIGRSVTLADALDDTLQCSMLIDWAKAQGM